MTTVETRRSRQGRGAFFFFVFFFWTLSACSFAAPAQEVQQNLEAQQNMVLDIRLSLSRAAGAAEKENLYLLLIEEFPETEDAEEAHWALSDLYLDEFGEPKEDEARKILEQFLARYPSSLWAPHVKSRLLWLRGEDEKLF
jgi:hypothetical protein